MSKLKVVEVADATGKTKDLLEGVNKKLATVPNLMKVMANSSPVLESYLGFSGALGHGKLPARLREELALLVSQENRCDYCLSAHTVFGKLAGLTPEQALASRKGEGDSENSTGALRFARRVLETKGAVSDEELAAVQAAGFSDGEVAEILAHVALTVFTNYFNVAAGVEVDFPKVSFTELA